MSDPAKIFDETVEEAQAVLASDLINYDQRMTKAGAPPIRFVHEYISKSRGAIRQAADLYAETRVAEELALAIELCFVSDPNAAIKVTLLDYLNGRFAALTQAKEKTDHE